MTQYKVGARLGNFAQVPALVIGEIGYAVDNKVFFVGDDTSTPPKIMTDKSAYSFEYPNVPYVKFNIIELFENGKIDGVTPSYLNQDNGFITRTSDNQFANRYIDSDEYFVILNSDGVDGNPKVTASQVLIDLIGGGGGTGSVRFFHGEDPPVDALPGDMFWSTIDFLLYIFITDGTTSGWVDIASIGSGVGAANANRTYVGLEPPHAAFIGDKFLDTEDYRLYMRLQDEGGTFWKEILSEQL